MDSKSIKFMGVTRWKFQAIRARVRAQAQMDVIGDDGTAEGGGYQVRWTYREETRCLMVYLLKKPFFVREDVAMSKLRDLVEAA